jgi:Ca-activated chloride channel family protein
MVPEGRVTFGAPSYLVLLLLVAACLVAIGGWTRWRSLARQSVVSAASGSGRRGWAHLVSPLLVTAAIASAALAAARPQFGDRTQEIEERGIDIAIVLDVSRSMDATDVAPSRLAAAQNELAFMLDGVEGDRVGLVVFAGEPLIRSPLTSDVGALQELVRAVDQERGLLPLGSDLGEGIEAGRRLLEDGTARSKAMVIVTDGEEYGTTLEFAIARAVRAGMRLHSIGFGTSEGAPVIDTDPATGVTTPRFDDSGAPVVTRLVEETLVAIAEEGGGQYVLADTEGAAARQIGGSLDSLRATTFAVRSTSLPIERFQIFAALALLLADVELLWRVLPVGDGRGRGRRSLLLGAPAVFLAGICTVSVADINEQGNDTYERGEYARSLELYQTAEARGPRGEIATNASNALHQLGQHEEAIEQARRALEDLPGNVTVEYTLGRHFAADGQFAGALEAFKRALLIDPDDADSKHNLEVVTILLTPTAEPTQAPAEGTPTPGAGDDGAPGGSAEEDPAGATTVPDQSSNNATQTARGTPSAAVPSQEELTDDELERAIEEALAGIEEEFTTEEALELLRLLEEENRRSVAEQSGDVARPGQPDY